MPDARAPIVAPRVVRGSRIVTAQGIGPASVHIENGRFTRVGAVDDAGPGAGILDAGDLVVLPGLVDTHVHVNEPGRTEWEGFESATRAAAAGGVTTILDMPLNSIPATTNVDALAVKIAAARGRIWVDTGFIGGVVPGNSRALLALHNAGVLAFKCFLVPSGVPEFDPVSEPELAEAMAVLAALGSVLMVHAELPAVIDAATRMAMPGDPRRYATWLASRPAAAERDAVALLVRLAGASGARVHIVHVSSGETPALISAARARGVRITAESCPHYLGLHATAIPDGATEYKCAPPIRTAADRDALWEALRRDELSMIVSDHSPCPPALKKRETGDFLAAWGGIASLQLGITIIWNCMHDRSLPVERLARWMSEAPARLVRLDGRKGRIAPGMDADFVLFDPDSEWTITTEALLQRHPLSPYVGKRRRGVVHATYLRGTLAYDREAGPAPEAGGQLLLPS